MFSLFADPFGFRRPVYSYGYRYPYDPFSYGRATDVFDRYLDAFERRLFADLALDSDQQSQESLKSPEAPASLESSAPREGSESSESPQASKPTPSTEPAESAKPTPPAKQATPEPVVTKQAVYQTKASFDGKNYVEEHRERVRGHDGEVRTVVRRRLGDRWYENETHRDKDGKETERETWHNVADDEIEGFKEEWSEKHQKAPSRPPAAIEPPAEPPKPTTD
jgi:hypothetical protein